MEVYLYGAGDYGHHAQKKIARLYGDMVQIRAFIDRAADRHSMGDVPVVRLEEVSDLDIPVVVAMGFNRAVHEVCGELARRGFQRVYKYLCKENAPYEEGTFFEKECFDMAELMDSRNGDWIPHIETHAVDYCNLNCKACTHYAPLFKESEFDPDTIYRDMEQFAAFSNRVLSFYIMGGEPFLREDLDEVVRRGRELFPKSILTVVTNGLLIPERVPERVLQAIVDAGALVSISEYKPTEKIIDRITKRLEDAHIDYVIRSAEDKENFIKTISIAADSPYPSLCISDGCVNLYRGHVSRCPSVMYLGRLNKAFSLELPTEGVYPIGAFSSVEEFNAQMTETIPLCAHCKSCQIAWEPGADVHRRGDFVIE